MDLKTACEKSGGVLYNDVCILGENRVVQIEPGRYLIDSPHGTFKVHASTIRLTSHGFYFPFNNCALEVTREKVYIKCFAPGKDNDVNVYFEETLSAAIGD